MEEVSSQSVTHEAMQSFLDAFEDESVRIMRSRKPSRDRAVVAVLMQQNRKWNDICHLIEQKYGYTPLKRNAYWKIMSAELGCAA